MASDDDNLKLMDEYELSTFGEEKEDPVFNEAEDIEELAPQSDFLGAVPATGSVWHMTMVILMALVSIIVGFVVCIVLQNTPWEPIAWMPPLVLSVMGLVLVLVLFHIPARYELYVGKLRIRLGPAGFWGFGLYSELASSQFSGRTEFAHVICSNPHLLLIRPDNTPLRIKPTDCERFKTLFRQALRS